MIPKRGDIVWVNFNPTQGHEQTGRRPALVLSNTRYNTATGMMIACPITGHVKGYPLEVPLPDGLKTKGVVLANQVKALDWQTRGFTPIESATDDLLENVLAVLEALLR